METWAVLLMAYGGPDSLEDVGPYLLDVRGGRETPPALVQEIRERYAQIGGKSPLLMITRRQARALEQELNRRAGGERFRVFVGMRHWKPYIRQAVEEIRAAGLNRVVALCMAPYYSKMSTGAYFEHLRKAQEETGCTDWDVRKVEYWSDHPGVIASQAGLVQEALQEFPATGRDDARVVFTAHSLPSALAEQGDPYAEHFRQSARLTAQAAGLPDDRWTTAFQSAGRSSARWLGPSLEETLHELAVEGARHVLVAPIGFVADHVEVLYDIDIEVQEEARLLGIHLGRTHSPNDRPAFIAALADIIEEKAKQI